MEQSQIQSHIEDFFQHAGFEIDEIIVVTDHEVGITIYSVRTSDSRALLYKNAEGLLALNYLLRKIIEQKSSDESPEDNNFLVDINNHQTKRIQELKTKARIVADRARSFKSSIELEPMSGYERMIIHSFLASAPNIHTESTGVGRNRKLVVKYIDQDATNLSI